MTLVTEPIASISADSITTDAGAEHPIDVIVYGTGFRASEFLNSFAVTGVDGVELHDFWRGEPRAYLGISVPGFLCLYGPNTNVVLNGSAVQFSEFSLNYVMDCIRFIIDSGAEAIDCRQEPFDTYNEMVDAVNQQMAWGQESVSNWYKSASGRVSQNWPFSAFRYWELTRKMNERDYTVIGKREDAQHCLISASSFTRA